jgi:hypothetical protein
MAHTLKRSDKHMAQECRYGCCTEVYGKGIKLTRRRVKRVSEGQFKRELRSGVLG